MGSALLGQKELADTLSETVGYKSGLALSIIQMCDLLKGTDYPDMILESEKHPVLVRSEEYEDLFYELLHRVGHTESKYDGDTSGVSLYHKYKNTALEEQHLGVLELFTKLLPDMIENASNSKNQLIDPTPLLEACAEKYGTIGIDMAVERLEIMNRGLALNPFSPNRFVEWKSIEALDNLFSGKTGDPAYGRFFDQRFIDFLSKNTDQLGNMHWRLFEELTAEFFERFGFQVDLGPGRNDDGVDIRIWKPKQDLNLPPHAIIQCKRQKEKIEKVIIKGLYADLQHEKAEYGLLVTSSELSPGARSTVVARGYPIREVNRKCIEDWLGKLRTPGTGIVRV